MAHTHTLLWSSFSSVRRVSLALHWPMQMHLLLSSGRSSYFRMVFCSFHFYLLLVGADLVESGPRCIGTKLLLAGCSGGSEREAVVFSQRLPHDTSYGPVVLVIIVVVITTVE